jgi:serine/threonine-protein kinase RsbW
MKYRILTPMIPKPTLDGIYEYLLDEGKKLGIPDPLLNQISMENAANIRINFPGHTSQLELIRRVTKQIAGIAPGFSDDDIEDISLALDEACTNVIRHSYRGKETGVIQVEICIEPTKVTISLMDKGEEGQLFNPALLTPVDKEKYLESLSKGGLGVYLIKKIMDEVEYVVSPGVRNCLTMVKYIYPKKKG